MPYSAFIRGIFLSFPFQAMFLGLYIFENAWVTIILYHFLMLLAMSISLSNEDFSKIFKGLNLPSCLLIGGIYLQAGPCLFFIHKYIDTSSWLSILSEWGLSGWSLGLFMLYFFTVNPVLEESFWRNLLGSKSKKLIIEDVLFGTYHSMILVHFVPVSILLVSVSALIIAAYIWRQQTTRLGGTLVPIMTHAAADLSLIMALWYIAKTTAAS
ncbi:MAG: CPBP family glutamic-type intramembrane protease [Verrucomicrobiota bacterium]